jgi:hypothetical protein
VRHPNLPDSVSFDTHSLSGGSDYRSGVRNVCRRVTQSLADIPEDLEER